MSKPSDLVRAALDLLILKTLSLDASHGWASAKRILQVSIDALQLQQSSLGHALHRMLAQEKHPRGASVQCLLPILLLLAFPLWRCEAQQIASSPSHVLGRARCLRAPESGLEISRPTQRNSF
jgi:hypothetical protein